MCRTPRRPRAPVFAADSQSSPRRGVLHLTPALPAACRSQPASGWLPSCHEQTLARGLPMALMRSGTPTWTGIANPPRHCARAGQALAGQRCCWGSHRYLRSDSNWPLGGLLSASPPARGGWPVWGGYARARRWTCHPNREDCQVTPLPPSGRRIYTRVDSPPQLHPCIRT